MMSDRSKLLWRLMEASDLASVSAVAAEVHPDFPEDDAVYLNRLSMYGQGVYVLENETIILGYAITHPWKSFDIPALNTVLEASPDRRNYYIHDIALMDAARGGGAASEIVSVLADHAMELGCQTISLVAVNGSSGFWKKHGFETANRPELKTKLKTYSDDACFMLRRLR